MRHIDQQTHKVEDYNFVKSINDKKQIIIASSLRKSNYHILRLKSKNRGRHTRWNCYTISREGSVYEHFNPKYYSNYLDIKKADKQSIVVVLENMGSLLKTPDGMYLNTLNEVCDNEFVGEKKWLGQKYWEIFPEVQLENLAGLCKVLCKKFKIPLKVIEFHHPHEKILDFTGIAFKSNYFENSNDVNPYMDIEKLNDLLTQ